MIVESDDTGHEHGCQVLYVGVTAEHTSHSLFDADLRKLSCPVRSQAYLGLGSNHVEPGRREDRKSVGCERTFREMRCEIFLSTSLTDADSEV